MATAPRPTLLNLPAELVQQIFQYLLVPGCIEQRQRPHRFGRASEHNMMYTETFLTYTRIAKARGLERVRNYYAGIGIIDFYDEQSRWRGNRYQHYQQRLMRRPGPSSPARKDSHLHSRSKSTLPFKGTGPHNPTIHDCSTRSPLSQRGINLIKENAICPCASCQGRVPRQLASPSTLFRSSNISTEEFFTPLLVCKKLYFRFRQMVFADNLFVFDSLRDLTRFASRLRSWQRDSMRKVQVGRDGGVVVVFDAGWK